jgi:8-oxo-dGTP pyrophosphatase MutT (NUDIX family)
VERLDLLKTLTVYQDLWAAGAAEEEAILTRFRAFVEETPACFDRATVAGHVTGSALVVSSDRRQVLLTLHRKLGKWLQLGGHADGDPRVHEVARREVEEESGLTELAFLPYEQTLYEQGYEQGPKAGGRTSLDWPLPFDLDCHAIPERPGEPAHVHYDVRYVIVADAGKPLVMSHESKDLRWFTVDEARKVTGERSMHRQFDKLEKLEALTRVTKILG